MSLRRARIIPLLLAAAAVLLAAVTLLMLLSPAPGHAQTTDVTYISNIAQGDDGDYTSVYNKAQSFTTGSQSGGYTVTHVDIGYDGTGGDAFSAAIYFHQRLRQSRLRGRRPHTPAQLRGRHPHLHRPRLHHPRGQHDLHRAHRQ